MNWIAKIQDELNSELYADSLNAAIKLNREDWIAIIDELLSDSPSEELHRLFDPDRGVEIIDAFPDFLNSLDAHSHRVATSALENIALSSDNDEIASRALELAHLIPDCIPSVSLVSRLKSLASDDSSCDVIYAILSERTDIVAQQFWENHEVGIDTDKDEYYLLALANNDPMQALRQAKDLTLDFDIAVDDALSQVVCYIFERARESIPEKGELKQFVRRNPPLFSLLAHCGLIGDSERNAAESRMSDSVATSGSIKSGLFYYPPANEGACSAADSLATINGGLFG